MKIANYVTIIQSDGTVKSKNEIIKVGFVTLELLEIVEFNCDMNE